jgi:AraC-like DNA-binding protein
MRTLFISVFLILLCAPQRSSAQSTIIDSLQNALAHHAYNDTARVNLLTTMAQKSWGGNPQLTKQCAEEALELAKTLNYKKGIADAYREMARYFWSQTEYDKAINHALIAVKQYQSLNNLEGISWCFGTIGISYAQANNFERSIYYQQEALILNRKISNKQGIARNLNNLGYVSELQKDFKKALNYYLQALAMRKEIGVQAEVIMPLSNVGSAHLALGDFDGARKYFEEALALAITTGNKNMEALQYQSLGEINYKKGNYNEARPFLLKSLALAEEIGDKKRKECTFEILRDVEKSDQNFEAAFNYQLKLQNLRDTLYSQERTLQVAELEARFDQERKEQAIILLERDARIQTLWNNILLAGFLLLLTAFILYYRLQRFREQKNREMLNLQIDLLTAQQKELAEKYKDALISIDEPEQESLDQRLLRNAIEVVEKHIGDPLFGVEKMADVMGMSRTNLHRKLKNVSGFTPSDFIRNVRLKRAAHLLKQQSDTVSQVGFTVGFEDQSYFSKCFKKQFGMSPTEYSRSIE